MAHLATHNAKAEKMFTACTAAQDRVGSCTSQRTTVTKGVPLTGEALKYAGDLLAHDLQLRNIGIGVHLLHQLHHRAHSSF